MTTPNPAEIDATNHETEQFLEMLAAHKGVIYKVAKCYCDNAEDLKDLMQEVVVQLWRARHRYDDKYAVSTWVYRIAFNVSISAFRKSSRRSAVSVQAAGPLVVVAPESPEEEQEDIRLLNQFIDELKELDRALMLLFLEGKSHKEMSTILGLSATNVATKLNRIKQKLKQRVTEHEHE